MHTACWPPRRTCEAKKSVKGGNVRKLRHKHELKAVWVCVVCVVCGVCVLTLFKILIPSFHSRHVLLAHH